MSLDVDEWADETVDDQAPVVEEPEPTLHFATLPAFVAHLATWYRRDVFDTKERIWCPEWWRHPEAVVRLEAMWRALESLRGDGATGISAWLRDHADVHMAQLMLPFGTFRGCTARDGHRLDDVLPELPVVEPPGGWWTEADSGL